MFDPLDLQTLYSKTKNRLTDAGVENGALAARILIKAVCAVSETDLIAQPDKEVTTEQDALLESYVLRRLSGEPVTKILGRAEFWGLPFKVSADTLDPRADTETLVEAALERFKDNPPATILDLGTGTGCIPIALLHEWPNARAVAVDISEKALVVAQENAQMNGVDDRITFVQSDWCEKLSGPFDLIVSNPPYIPNQDVESLSAEVKNHDPVLALAGGEGGLNAYKRIFSQIPQFLKPGARVFVEVGYAQADDVTRIAKDTGANLSRIYPDLAGIPRVVEISYGDK